MPVYSYDPPDRFIAGTVGQPGERTFYLQATGGGRVTSTVGAGWWSGIISGDRCSGTWQGSRTQAF